MPRLALVVALLALAPLAGPAPRVAVAAPAPAATLAAPETWRIDVTHSELSFRIRHLVSRVRGSFRDWNGSITVDPQDWSTAKVDVSIRTASIDTQQERRDNHLRSPDFFAADSFPTITFSSTRLERRGDDVTLHGNLTMRGRTRPVVLTGKFLGITKEANGAQRAGIEARTTINRLDYGIAWNRVAEGSNVLGDEVEIELVIAAVRRPEGAAAR